MKTDEKRMTVSELRKLLERDEAGMDCGDWTIWIKTSDGGFPSTPGVGVRTAGCGFDWNHGKFILYPNVPLSSKPKRKPRA